MTEPADTVTVEPHGDGADAIRAWLDARLAGFTRQGPRPLSCRPRCTACCHYPARVHRWELEGLERAIAALPQARRRAVKRSGLLALRRLKPLRARWRGAFPESEEARLAYGRAGLRCPLLDDQDLCAVYPSRPAHCRLHVVVSAPELCAGGDQPVMVPDLAWLEQALAERVAASGLGALDQGVLLVDAVVRALRGR